MRRAIVGLVLIIPTQPPTQKPVSVTLAPATARVAPTIKGITAIREIADGRLLLADPQGAGLIALRLETGAIERVGRVGRGPGEYSFAAPIYAIGGDSTLMVDIRAQRWLLIHGARMAATLSAAKPAV